MIDLRTIKPIEPIRAKGSKFQEDIVVFDKEGTPIAAGSPYLCRDIVIKKELVTASAIKHKQTLPSQMVRAAENKTIFYGLTIKFYKDIEVA